MERPATQNQLSQSLPNMSRSAKILALTWDNIGRSKIPNEKKHGADHEDIKSGCPGVGPVLAGISAQQGIKRVKRT